MSKQYIVNNLSDDDSLSFGTSETMSYEEVVTLFNETYTVEEIAELAAMWELGELPVGEDMTIETDASSMKIRRIEDGE